MIGRRLWLLAALALVATGLVAGQGTAPAAGTLVADYCLQGHLGDCAGSGTTLEEVLDVGSNQFVTDTVLGEQRTVLSFPAGNGLMLDTTNLIANDHYSVAILFRFDETTGYRSILNFTDRASDEGLYNHHGALHLYPDFGQQTNVTITPSTYVQVVLTRDANGEVIGFVNGNHEQFHGLDRNGLAVIDANNILRFFDDNSAEESAGAVARIRIFSGALTNAQVAALDDTPPPATNEPPPEECEKNPEAQCGTTGDDDLSSNDGVVIGGPGDDTITGTVDSSTTELILDAGDDNDTITLNIEDVTNPVEVSIFGGAGSDAIFVPVDPGALSPTLSSGSGSDVIKVFTQSTSSPRVSIRSQGDGHYLINSGLGNDQVTSGASSDEVFGAGGADSLRGAAGADSIEGGAGSDTVNGGSGTDVVRGNSGRNRLVGGTGRDTCISDDPADTFRSCERIRRNHRRNHSRF